MTTSLPDPDAQSPSLGSAKNILHWLPCCWSPFPTQQRVWDIIPGIPTHDGNETGISAPQSPKVGLKEAQREKWTPSPSFPGNPKSGVERDPPHVVLSLQVLTL